MNRSGSARTNRSGQALQLRVRSSVVRVGSGEGGQGSEAGQVGCCYDRVIVERT